MTTSPAERLTNAPNCKYRDTKRYAGGCQFPKCVQGEGACSEGIRALWAHIDHLTSSAQPAAQWHREADAYIQAVNDAAALHEEINPASDAERLRGDPGAGALGAVLEYRDKIRALLEFPSPPPEPRGTT